MLIGISTDNIVHCFVWSGIVNTNPIPLVEKNDPHAIGALIPLFLAHACLENAGSIDCNDRRDVSVVYYYCRSLWFRKGFGACYLPRINALKKVDTLTTSPQYIPTSSCDPS